MTNGNKSYTCEYCRLARHVWRLQVVDEHGGLVYVNQRLELQPGSSLFDHVRSMLEWCRILIDGDTLNFKEVPW